MVTLSEDSTKSHNQERERERERAGTAKGSVNIIKPIRFSSNETPTKRCVTLLEMLAQTQGGYGEHKLNITYV